MTESSQLFSNMYRAAVAWLKDRDPREISRKANVPFDGEAFRFESLGLPVRITYPDYAVSPEMGQWQTLILLHYLATADGAPLSGRQIVFADHKDGMVRGGGFDREAESAISQKLGRLSCGELERRCLALGARTEASNADFCAVFSFAPNYPVWLKIWFADEEFPASGRVLLDAAAEHYLSIEDAVTVGGVILDKLCAD